MKRWSVVRELKRRWVSTFARSFVCVVPLAGINTLQHLDLDLHGISEC